MRDLATLDPERFSRREHAALVWVRSFLTCPDGVPAAVEEEFRAELSGDEQVCVVASMKGMFCVNLLVNTARYAMGRRSESISCQL